AQGIYKSNVPIGLSTRANSRYGRILFGAFLTNCDILYVFASCILFSLNSSLLS
uniref:Uncharacterized protein n=1 Tax=Ciona intestinalis TaxID=7719 RepID=H2XXD6_CIOIN